MYKNRVCWTQYLCMKTEFNKLDFWAYVDTLSNSDTGKIRNLSSSDLIYNPKIDQSRLELLNRKYV